MPEETRVHLRSRRGFLGNCRSRICRLGSASERQADASDDTVPIVFFLAGKLISTQWTIRPEKLHRS